MTNITRSERNIAHRLIEESCSPPIAPSPRIFFTAASNRSIAFMRSRTPAKSRVRRAGSRLRLLSRVEDLHQREVAVRHGRVPAPTKAGRPDSFGHGRERGMKVALPGSELRITPQHYQRLIKKVVGKPEERIISYLMLRSLKAGPLRRRASRAFCPRLRRVHPFHLAHSAVSRPHRSSHPEMGARPSQRCSVLFEAARRHTPGAEAVLYSHKNLEEIAAETSEAERRANGAERELMDWKTAQFMEEHLARNTTA